MLDIVLKILAILGIVLLILLAILLIGLLLVLFFPITYRAFGKKYPEDMSAWVKVNWLFGLIRARFYYPDPGTLTVKLLWFTLYDTGQDTKQNKEKHKTEEKEETTPQAKEQTTKTYEAGQSAAIEANTPETNAEVEQTDASETLTGGDSVSDTENTSAESDSTEKGLKQWIFAKYEKIKYTIQKIYDKIKHIWENITFYKALLQDEQTVALFRHAWFRIGRILRNIRPRKIKGQILFGTGSPDTTGYAFGVYGMLLPLLGKHINVTPDFTQAILEGELYLAGHITLFQVLLHTLMLVFDKRLRLLLHRIKAHKI